MKFLSTQFYLHDRICNRGYFKSIGLLSPERQKSMLSGKSFHQSLINRAMRFCTYRDYLVRNDSLTALEKMDNSSLLKYIKSECKKLRFVFN